jgi:hypothetical protein
MVDEIVVTQSPVKQAIGEPIAWTIDFTDLGTPTAVDSCLVYDATGADKSGTLLAGAASIGGNVVTCKLFTPASAQTYRIAVQVTLSGNHPYGILDIDVVPVIPTPVTVTNGYCTVAELRRYIAPNTQADYNDDVIIGAIIEAASRYIDGQTGRTFYARSETHYYDVPDDDTLWIYDDELLTITSLTNGNAALILVASYNLFPKNKPPYYAIKLKTTSGVYWEPTTVGEYEGAITLVGTFGYSATAPADIKSACMQIASSLYKRRFGENTTGTATITGAGVVVMPTDVPTTAQGIIGRYKMVV